MHSAATPWGTFNPLILDPIWTVLAAIAVQITDLADRIAKDRKPLNLEKAHTIFTSTSESIEWSADGLKWVSLVPDFAGHEALIVESGNKGGARGELIGAHR